MEKPENKSTSFYTPQMEQAYWDHIKKIMETENLSEAEAIDKSLNSRAEDTTEQMIGKTSITMQGKPSTGSNK